MTAVTEVPRPRPRRPSTPCGSPTSSGSATTPSPSPSTCPPHLQETFALPARPVPHAAPAHRRGGRSAARTRSAPRPVPCPGSGCAGSTPGLFSEWLVDRLAPGDEIEVAPPSGSFTPDLTAATHHGLIAAGFRDHPGAVHRGERARRAPRHPGHPALRQPAHRHGDVHRGARRPEERLRPAAAPAARAVPGADGGRDLHRPARRATSCAPCSTRWSTWPAWTSGGSAGRWA